MKGNQSAVPPINEIEVYVTKDGLGRASIAQRSDGFFCIYVRWLWPEHGQNWLWGEFPDIEYVDYSQEPHQPEIGIYGTVDDARKEVMRLQDFKTGPLGEPPWIKTHATSTRSCKP